MRIIRFFNFMGFDFTAEIEFRVTYRGCEARTYGPPENCYPAEAPEWEVESISIYPDENKNWSYPEHETTGELFNSLSEHFSDDIAEAIAHYDLDID